VPDHAVPSPTASETPPPAAFSSGGKVRIQVEGAGQRYKVQVEVGGRTFPCHEVTIETPCVLTELPQGPGLVRATGSADFVKDVGVTDWPTRVRINRAGYGPLFGGLVVAALGVGLMVGTDIGSVPYSLGAGFLAGGTTIVVWDVGRNHDVVNVEADSLAANKGSRARAGLSWRFSF
jgi:hypothetical protein